jgi:hypothetical protein
LSTNDVILSIPRVESDTITLAVDEVVLLIGVTEISTNADEFAHEATVLGSDSQQVVVKLPLDAAKQAALYLAPNKRLILLRLQR